MGFDLALDLPPGVLSSGAYWQQLLSIPDLIALWRQNELTGTDSIDSSGNGHDGTYTGVTLADGVGPDGSPVPFFDGVNDLNDVYSAGLAAAFNEAEGSFIAWARVDEGAVWVDNARREIIRFLASGTDFILMDKDDNNLLRWSYTAGGTAETVTKAATPDGWFLMGLTWSATDDEVKAYYNGVQEGATQTGLGTFTGDLGATTTCIGAASTAAANVWNGGVGIGALWGRALTGAEMRSTHFEPLNVPKRLLTEASEALLTETGEELILE